MQSTWLPAAALALGLAFAPAPSPAHAQDPADPTTTGTGTLRVTYLRVDDETVSGIAPRPLGVEECTPPAATLTFEVDNIPSDKGRIDIYYGSECNAMDRDDTTTPRCTFVQDVEATSQQDLEVKIDAGKLCDKEDPTLWFLAVNSSQVGEDVGQGYDDILVPIDLSAPAAPDNVEGGAGEKAIPVSWDIGTGDPEKFVVYIDDQASSGGGDTDGGTSSDGKCSSSRLAAGTAAKDIPKGVRTKTIDEGTATGIDLDSGDIRGKLAAVGVVAVDQAGNESVLSEIACVEVVPTEGFWERYEKEGGNADEGCSVKRAGAGTRASDRAAGLLATACALVVALRFRARRGGR